MKKKPDHIILTCNITEKMALNLNTYLSLERFNRKDPKLSKDDFSKEIVMLGLQKYKEDKWSKGDDAIKKDD